MCHFQKEVFIDSTLTVRGSVIGSGPYMDSSDSRFKRDIIPITSVLEDITSLQAVSYSYKNDEFPDRNFPDTRQVGYIADDIEKIFPSVVENDKDGYRHVAYSHLSVLIAEAVKELRAETRSEISRLKKKVTDLEEEISLLRSR